ncbi:hypothetical protein [Methylobacterium sp. SyP6R]|uniref:hypothetical protein n=1 Tax=Methylobacterium sp. SyP6R TaxID=2718876 RepID=UPI001F43A974|nr:hypothetical protein [Methylobacterium sp. SyP6R]MCF4130066.1 hypothetical protein [Methylobacterium sp. SyP6R]
MQRDEGAVLEVIGDASALSDPERSRVLTDILDVMETCWDFDRDGVAQAFGAENFPFQSGYGVVFCHRGRRAVGYSIFFRVPLGTDHALYRAGAAVRPEERGRSCYRLLTEIMLREGFPADDTGTRYLAWRTRNPFVWQFNARLCREVAPAPLSLGSAHLREACERIARIVYPRQLLLVPKMIMRDVYLHLSEKRPGTALDPTIDAWLSRTIPNPRDAIFAVGMLR